MQQFHCEITAHIASVNVALYAFTRHIQSDVYITAVSYAVQIFLKFQASMV
jgi:hypothetical protein